MFLIPVSGVGSPFTISEYEFQFGISGLFTIWDCEILIGWMHILTCISFYFPTPHLEATKGLRDVQTPCRCFPAIRLSVLDRYFPVLIVPLAYIITPPLLLKTPTLCRSVGYACQTSLCNSKFRFRQWHQSPTLHTKERYRIQMGP